MIPPIRRIAVTISISLIAGLLIAICAYFDGGGLDILGLSVLRPISSLLMAIPWLVATLIMIRFGFAAVALSAVGGLAGVAMGLHFSIRAEAAQSGSFPGKSEVIALIAGITAGMILPGAIGALLKRVIVDYRRKRAGSP